MGRLQVVVKRELRQGENNARGKLFEKLCADVLRHYGYTIDATPNVNYAGMELDIEGHQTATGVPLYAECKCYQSDVDSSKVQAFYGKFMAKWFKDKRSQGLILAIPDINSHAQGFFNENMRDNPDVTVSLYNEERVLKAIFASGSVVTPEAIAAKFQRTDSIVGDWCVMYTEKGCYFVQYLIRPGSTVASEIALLDQSGAFVTNTVDIEYLIALVPSLADFTIASTEMPRPASPSAVQFDEIVEVRGSSECFEYQFPASPEYFVGRKDLLAESTKFAQDVLGGRTSSRGLLLEANSGWGKSSAVLAMVDQLKKAGHFAVAIDSRSASSSQFILRAISHTLASLASSGQCPEDVGKAISDIKITGFEGAAAALAKTDDVLKAHDCLLFIFLDQFENCHRAL
jgi:hypothetical protein